MVRLSDQADPSQRVELFDNTSPLWASVTPPPLRAPGLFGSQMRHEAVIWISWQRIIISNIFHGLCVKCHYAFYSASKSFIYPVQKTFLVAFIHTNDFSRVAQYELHTSALVLGGWLLSTSHSFWHSTSRTFWPAIRRGASILFMASIWARRFKVLLVQPHPIIFTVGRTKAESETPSGNLKCPKVPVMQHQSEKSEK